MRNVNRQQTNEVRFPKSRRPVPVEVLTSAPAGKCVPLAAIPLLREDSGHGSMRVSVEMLETHELLMNPVNMRVMAYLVPWLAMERFEKSRDQFDRSYMGQAQVEGGAVVPFFETDPYGAQGSNEVYKYLGLTAEAADEVNTMYLEAYNTIYNFRAKNRSPNLTPRARLATTLAPAFWTHSRFQHIVPDFDQAVIDGEVALNIVNADLDLRGKVMTNGYDANRGYAAFFRESAPATAISLQNTASNTGVVTSNNNPQASLNTLRPYVDLTQIVAELAADGITVSLSNLELARKTQAFAKMRQKYEGLPDEYIIDMLMQGLSIPDLAWTQPILLADQEVRIGQVKRYATDAGNLASSAVSGGAALDLRWHAPRSETGGVVMIVAECLPVQLFERQRDPFFYTSDVATLPDALRDTLDPEKVVIVQNGEIDTNHATPTDTFGYAPLNWQWASGGPRIGGKFYKPVAGGAEIVARQRIWAVDVEDPVLGDDFYIAPTLPTDPFLDEAVDPFEITVMGGAAITGNTQFGGLLVEPTAVSNYDEVMEKAPTERIDKDA